MMEMWNNCFNVGLVEILSNNKNALSVDKMQLTDSLVEKTHTLFYVSAGGTYTAAMITEDNFWASRRVCSSQLDVL